MHSQMCNLTTKREDFRDLILHAMPSHILMIVACMMSNSPFLIFFFSRHMWKWHFAYPVTAALMTLTAWHNLLLFASTKKNNFLTIFLVISLLNFKLTTFHISLFFVVIVWTIFYWHHTPCPFLWISRVKLCDEEA